MENRTSEPTNDREYSLYESVSSTLRKDDIDIKQLKESFNQNVTTPSSLLGITVTSPTIRIVQNTVYSMNESTGEKERIDLIEGVVYYWTESDPNEERPYIIKHLYVPVTKSL